MEGQRIVQLTLQALQNIPTENGSDSFYESALVKASKHEFVSKPILRTKRRYLNY